MPCAITRFILTFAPNWGRDHPAIVVNHGNLAKAVAISGQGGVARGVFYHLILMARLLMAITQNKAVLLADNSE